jgi:hypothetical protein
MWSEVAHTRAKHKSAEEGAIERFDLLHHHRLPRLGKGNRAAKHKSGEEARGQQQLSRLSELAIAWRWAVRVSVDGKGTT